MSISPAQMVLQAASAESPAASRPSPQPAPSQAAPAARTAESVSSAAAPAVASPNPVSTDLRIDNQHQFYYEFVDESTGSVVFEIPPEALRAIGESLNLPPNGEASGNSVDVKS